jgi:hypothetical protein
MSPAIKVFKIVSVSTPPVRHERQSAYTAVVPWVVAVEIPEFEVDLAGDRATATDTMLGYVYEFHLRQTAPFASSLGRQRPPADPANLSRATGAVLAKARETGLIPKS